MDERLSTLTRMFRASPRDGALLFFDRDSGDNVLVDGDETAALCAVAPRAIQFGITNRCNLACAFCSRDVAADSAWSAGSAFTLLSALAQRGVLEVAFGGGEPFAFTGFATLAARLHDETPLAVHATTNGLLLTRDRLRALRGKLGELRLSLYDDNEWPRTLSLLVEEEWRFGVNYLVLPERLDELEAFVMQLVAMGCRDVLLLSYNGPDRERHLSAAQARELAERVATLHRALGAHCRLSLDVCWGERMERVPRHIARDDCGAGRDFLVVTSDRRVMPCSFHHVAIPFDDADDLLKIWHTRRAELSSPSTTPGCARRADYGLGGTS
jgi:MoaA/NifB/PqqE/SkfB family radical SAM enzyme